MRLPGGDLPIQILLATIVMRSPAVEGGQRVALSAWPFRGGERSPDFFKPLRKRYDVDIGKLFDIPFLEGRILFTVIVDKRGLVNRRRLVVDAPDNSAAARWNTLSGNASRTISPPLKRSLLIADRVRVARLLSCTGSSMLYETGTADPSPEL